MIRALKIFLTIILVFVLSIVAYTSSYFFVEIRPHIELLDIEASIHNVESPNASKLKQAIELVGGQRSISMIKHRTAIRFIPTNEQFRGYWHLIGLHWQLWMSILYSEDEIYALRLARFYYRGGYGISGAAQYYFSTDFQELSCKQIVELSLLDKNSNYFKLNSNQQQQYINNNNLMSLCRS